MGMFKTKVKVSNSKDSSLFFEEEFWVDTGALYSFIPEEYLERIGVEPATKRNLILADGRHDTRLLGFCDFQIDSFEGQIPCPVIFAPAGSLFLLGATALENFGVDADPIQKKLKPKTEIPSAPSRGVLNLSTGSRLPFRHSRAGGNPVFFVYNSGMNLDAGRSLS